MSAPSPNGTALVDELGLAELEDATSAQLCTFSVDGLLFGVEVGAVQEVIREQDTTPVPLASPVVTGLMNLRGQIVTTLDLRTRLGMPPRVDGDPPMNVVLSTEDGAVALLVDSIGDVIAVEDAAHEPPPPTLRGALRAVVSGTYKLPQGLVLVLDHRLVLDHGNGTSNRGE